MLPVLFCLTLPRDTRMLPAIREIAERVAQCAGYSSADAMRIAASVGQAAEAVVDELSKDLPDQQIEVRFEREDQFLDVWLRYKVGREARGPAAVDAPLSREMLRQGMDSVEFGDEQGVAYCHLRRQLPHDKVEHRCEMPPSEAH